MIYARRAARLAARFALAARSSLLLLVALGDVVFKRVEPAFAKVL